MNPSHHPRTPRTAVVEAVPETQPEAPQSQSEAGTQSDAQGKPFPAEGLGGPKTRPLTYGQFQDGVESILASLGVLPLDHEPVPRAPMIYKAMAAVLKDLPPVPKDQENKSQGFAFQGVDDILDKLNPVLGRHGVFYVPVVEERVAETRQARGGGTIWTVHLRVRYTFFAADGSHVEAVSWGEGTDSGDKATSKAMTMAMKSCLRQVFAISDNEDPDATSVPTDPVPDRIPLSDEDRQDLQNEIDNLSEAAQAKLKELWIAQKGALPSLKNASEEHVPAIGALIAEAATLADQDQAEVPAEAEAAQ